MLWWTAMIAVLALAGAAIALRKSFLSFLTLAAFVPLALYTLYNDFDRFWVLIIAGLVVLTGGLVRNSGIEAVAVPAMPERGGSATG